MDYERQFKAKLLALFCLVGMINAFFISQIYYLDTKKALIERASSQLISVRELFETRFAHIQQYHPTQEYDALERTLKMKAGMGDSGEMYLVDTNLRISSSSRFGPQWLNRPANNEAAINATQGKRGIALLKDYRGVDVISAYGPIVYNNKTFGLICELDMSEVLAPLQETKKKIILVCALLVLGTFVLSLFLSSQMINFLRRMRDEINVLTNKTSLRIIEAQEQERAKISHDIHDGIGQLMTSLKWQLSLKNNNDDLVELCNKVLSEVRSISQNVVPSVLTDFGIFVALDEMFESLKKLQDPKIQFSISDAVRDLHFSPSFELNLYRIIQELIQNGLKHSQSKNMQVKLELLDSTLQIIYRDDGKGFNASESPPKSLDYRVKLFTGTMIKQESVAGCHCLFTFNLTEVTNESMHR